MPGPVAQPQVGAREAGGKDEFHPGLQALNGGGRGGGGQAPLLLSVHEEAPASPAVPADYRLIAEAMTALYGVPVRLDHAARTALQVLGDQRPADPTAHVLAALQADPDAYRPTVQPAARRRAAGNS
jgi:hypothetical protein